MKGFFILQQQQLNYILFITTVNFYYNAPLISATLDPAARRYDTYDKPSRECEIIIVDMCKGDLGYNYTGGPNFLNEDTYTQQDSRDLLLTFQPLISHGCSTQLKPFLCTAYVPMCDPQVEQLIGPCRSVCENVKRRCQPFLQAIGYPWPVALNCSVFPATNTEETMCMEFPEEEEDGNSNIFDKPASSTKDEKSEEVKHSEKFDVSKKSDEAKTFEEANNLVVKPLAVTEPPCSSSRKPSAYKYLNSTGECHPRCNVENLFNNREKQFAEVWMAVWTAFCLLFSTMTVITFLMDTSQFRYPKRPIIFLSLCYTLYSIAYLIRLIAGREQVTCDSDQIMTQGLDNTNCAAIFLLLYYFSTAAALWWVILSLAWLLSAGLRWSHDAIELYSSYFHLVAWGIPAVQSIIIIVFRNVSSEELTGLCFVGSSNPTSLLGFVIVPLAAYLLLGITLLVAGYILLFRQEKKETSKSEERIEVLMVRIGIFSLLYTVSSTCLLACYFYEYFSFYSWHDKRYMNTPSVEIFILKIFSALFPGVTSGLCVLGCNTLDTWTNICSNICFKQYSSSGKVVSQQSNNNNNSSVRQYIPVNTHHSKPVGTGSTHSTSRTSRTSSNHRPPSHSHSQRYVYSPHSAQPLRQPTEYHV